jgi:beta-lactamase class A
MDRRTFFALCVPATALLTNVAWAGDQGGSPSDFYAARRQFLALPGQKSLAVQVVEDEAVIWRNTYDPNASLFVGSAIKTFILATYLQEVEAGQLSEDALLTIDDGVRSLSSSVFGSNLEAADNLAGSASARTVLEAMISHSDNTATDTALLQVGVDKVRAFISSAGLTATRIPDSTRLLFSYLAGAPFGVDEGWNGMKEIIEGHLFGTPRSPVNGEETMISTASEMVSYYERALAGRFFKSAQTLTEFKRIQAMADVIAVIVPPGIAAYAKGGSIDWQGFHALASPGQMIVGRAAVTFCFTVNWMGPDSSVPEVLAQGAKAVAGMLAAVANWITREAPTP